jgi:L-alanine-DL-glutamate epimerase-like enolase superfamily enzyme
VTPTVERLEWSVYSIPTDAPESDGTAEWDSTTLVVVEALSGGTRGIGYTYGLAAIADVVAGKLAAVVRGRDAFAVEGAWRAMVAAVRNGGRPGVCAMAISAVDAALWDLKARLLGVPLFRLIGAVRDRIDVYGSGGFTSYDVDRLQAQLAGWVAEGIPRVKMKVGRGHDAERVRAARETIGPEAALFVDANGAWSPRQALEMAEAFAACGVRWFEEPVSSDDLDGLRRVRDRAPPGMDVAAGEYGSDPWYFRAMLAAGAVDVLQADATRCLGVTGFLKAAALCEAFQVRLSAHCAPSLHFHPCCAAGPAVHLEYFHDHARIEHLLFDGAPRPVGGALVPDPEQPGNGLALRRGEAARFAVR